MKRRRTTRVYAASPEPQLSGLLNTRETLFRSLPPTPRVQSQSLLSVLEQVEQPHHLRKAFSKIRQVMGTSALFKISEFLIRKEIVSSSFLLFHGLHETARICNIPSPLPHVAVVDPPEVERFNNIDRVPVLETLFNKPTTPILNLEKPIRKQKKPKTILQRRKANKWSRQESKYLRELIEEHEENEEKIVWCRLASSVNERFHQDKTGGSAAQHYNRVILADVISSWTLEEEKTLIKHVEAHNTTLWSELARKIDKTDVQCRYFYKKYYQSEKQSPWKPEQIELLKVEGEYATDWGDVSVLVNQNSKFHHSPLQCLSKYQEL